MVSRARKAAAQVSYQQGERKNIFYNGDVKYAVPIDEGNTEYIIIKRLADAGTITIADAD